MKKISSALVVPLLLTAAQTMESDYGNLQKTIDNQKAKPGTFHQRIEAGYLGTTGNSETQTVYGLYGNDYQWTERIDLHLRADTYYASSRGETTDERYRAYAIGNHTLSARWYNYLEAGFLRDPYAGYDAQYNVGLGMGYKIFDTKEKLLKIRAGYQYRHAEMTDDTGDSFHYLKLGLNGSYFFTEKNKLETEVNFLEDLKTSADYETVFRIALKSHIVDRLSLKIGFELKYDNTPPLEDDGTEKEKTDTTTTVSIVYDF